MIEEIQLHRKTGVSKLKGLMSEKAQLNQQIERAPREKRYTHRDILGKFMNSNNVNNIFKTSKVVYKGFRVLLVFSAVKQEAGSDQDILYKLVEDKDCDSKILYPSQTAVIWRAKFKKIYFYICVDSEGIPPINLYLRKNVEGCLLMK